MDDETERLAREAIESDAPLTVSGARIRDELLDMLHEFPERAAARMRDLRLDRALSPLLGDARPEDVGAAAEATERVGGQRRFAAVAMLIASDPDGLAAFIEDLNLRAEDRDAVLHAARKGPQLVRSLESDLPDSAVHALLHCELPETLAVAIALGAREEPIRHYLEQLSAQRLEITGDDLRAAGIPEGPAIGRALRETLKRKLDGEVAGRDAELALALDLAREGE
jgi:tRNA nucleotidyltransferase (CCA-adding enzyme)